MTKLDDFTVKHDAETFSAKGDVNLQFWVHTTDGKTDLAIDITVEDLKFEASILINGFELSGNITKVRVDKLVQNSCTFGDLPVDTVKVALNTAFMIATPLINVFISKYQVKIPSNIFGIFELSDLVLSYMDGYVSAGATPTFLPPSLQEPLLILQ